MSALTQLATALSSGSVSVIDLTQTLAELPGFSRRSDEDGKA